MTRPGLAKVVITKMAHERLPFRTRAATFDGGPCALRHEWRGTGVVKSDVAHILQWVASEEPGRNYVEASSGKGPAIRGIHRYRSRRNGTAECVTGRARPPLESAATRKSRARPSTPIVPDDYRRRETHGQKDSTWKGEHQQGENTGTRGGGANPRTPRGASAETARRARPRGTRPCYGC